MPKDVRGRKAVLEWLFWQVGGLGPMSGQRGHFVNVAPKGNEYALERYSKETNRLHGVLDLDSPEPSRFTEADARAIEAFAARLVAGCDL